MTRFIEAICYARWSDQKAGFSWQTTLAEDADKRVKTIVKNIQTLWDQIEYQNPIWLQGEWSEELDAVYFGLVKKDQDENGRPTHIKEVWIIEKELWRELGANSGHFWENHRWFTEFGTQQADLFLSNARKNKNLLTSPPPWLPSLVSLLISSESKPLVVEEENVGDILQILSLLPINLKNNIKHIAIGWHPSLLNVTTHYDIVFCRQKNLENCLEALKPYGGHLITPNASVNDQAQSIVGSMFSKTQSSSTLSTVSQEDPPQSLPQKKSPVVPMILVILAVGMAFFWFAVKRPSDLQKKIDGLSQKIQTLEGKNDKLEEQNSKLRIENREVEDKIKDLERKNQELQKQKSKQKKEGSR